MLNLQMLYLILGNFCNAFAVQRLSTGTHTLKRFSFLFFFFLKFCFIIFFLPKPQVMLKIVIYLCILLCYEPLQLSETYGLLTYCLCVLILS